SYLAHFGAPFAFAPVSGRGYNTRLIRKYAATKCERYACDPGMNKDTRMSQITTQLDDSGVVDPCQPADPSRRTWVGVACALGGVAGAATAVPFVASFAPSERARAAGAPVEVDISGLQPGQMTTVEWRGKPVWVLRRTEAQLAALPKLDSKLADPNSDRPGFTPAFAKNEYRSRNPEFFVAVGI